MLVQALRPYTITYGLLLLPAIAWNAALFEHLPPAISRSEFWDAIPRPLAIVENTLRILVFAMPFFMPLRLSTRIQRRGLVLFVFGTLVYFASWLALIAYPHSSWSSSAVGFLAPAYTPALWLFGLALLAREFSWGSALRPWMYPTLSALFLAAHLSHAAIVYAQSYRGAGA